MMSTRKRITKILNDKILAKKKRARNSHRSPKYYLIISLLCMFIFVSFSDQFISSRIISSNSRVSLLNSPSFSPNEKTMKSYSFSTLNENLLVNEISVEDTDETEYEDEEEDNRDQEIDEEFKKENDRESSVAIQEYSFEIESERSSSYIEDYLYYYGEITENGIEIDMSYASATETSEFEFSATLLIESIIIYTDTNFDEYYNETIDPIEKQFTLNNFRPIEYTLSQVSPEVMEYHLAWTSQDELFTLHLIYSDGFLSLNNTGDFISPTSLKMDFEMNLPFLEGSVNNNTRIAVKMSLITEQSFEVEEEEETEDEKLGLSKDETALALLFPSLGSEEISPFFSWKDYAYVDNASVNVKVQSELSNKESDGDSSSSSLKITFNYPSGASLYHDPKVGVEGIYVGTPFSSSTETSSSTEGPSGGNTQTDTLLGWWSKLLQRETILIFTLLILAIVFLLIMTKQEFRSYLLNRVAFYSTAPHRLTMEEVLENEIRSKIINLILENPGIHYSEIARQVNTSASNLAWHLDILESYKIIHKQRIGQYLIFYPYVENNPFSETHSALVKSKTTLEILGIIGDHPGIIQAQIARRMDLNRKTIEYHLKKLSEAGLIYSEKKGRKKYWYVSAKKGEEN